MSKSGIFNVCNFAYGCPNIRQYYASVEQLHIETIADQMACRKLWLQERNEVKNRLYWPSSKLNSWKLQKLRQLVDWAYNTTDFYRELYRNAGYEPGCIQSIGDFESLPRITRNDLVSSFPDKIRSRMYTTGKCKWMSTSGSSGQPVEVWLQPERTYWDTIFRYRQFEYMSGYSLRSKDWIYNIHHAPWWYSSLNGDYPVFTVDQDCPVESVLNHIKRLKPVYISTVASYLTKLSEFPGDLSQYGVRLISTNSEASSATLRRKLAEKMCIPILDEYSSEELDLIASECPEGRYHVVEDETYVELVDADEDGVGCLVGTDLWNFAMPIIRYDQGDLVQWDIQSNDCSCGSAFRAITNIQGRKNDIFYKVNGEAVLTASLLDACEDAFCRSMPSIQLKEEDPNVSEFCLIQTEINKIKALVVVRDTRFPVNPLSRKWLTENLQDLFGDQLTVEFEEVSKIPKKGKYKRKVLVSELTGDK